nr:unnamed protein product [Callosobruchus analis]
MPKMERQGRDVGRNKLSNLVADYTMHMGSVDKADMLKKCYSTDRKSKKWYHRANWHFLDTTVVNA